MTETSQPLANGAAAHAPEQPGEDAKRRRGGRRPGEWKNGVRVADGFTGTPKASRSQPAAAHVEAGQCRGCEAQIVPLSLDLVRELVRMARDRFDAAKGEGAAPETDVRYLAARFDGYCSLGCYQSTRA